MKPAHIDSYRDLRVWQMAMDLTELGYRATNGYPTIERYGLVSQMRRAVVSIASNIAEGHARTTGDYVRHLFIATGSLAEFETQLVLSERLGYLPADHIGELLQKCDGLSRMLSGLRRRLQARRSRT